VNPRHHLKKFSALLVAGIVIAGCDSDSTAPSNKEIAIGGLFSLTGNWATLGVASKAAMEIGIEDVNAYLAAGTTGMHFTASIQDTKLIPATALSAVTAMKGAGVEVVIGPQSSAEVGALRSEAAQSGVVLISQGSTAHSLAFAKPVLLVNGDSHHYRSDNPLKAGQPCEFESGADTVDCLTIPAAVDFTPDAWNNHPVYNVPNFHRVVVHGSTEPLEWLRLTVTPGATAVASSDAFGPFSWERVLP